MANLTVTAASVVPSAGAGVVNGTAGASITAGQSVYLDTTDNTWKLADADAAASINDAGIALHASSTNQPIAVQQTGTLNIGATVSIGTAYYVSTTAGGICLESDLATGDFPFLLGYATAASTITMYRRNFGVAKA